MQQTKEVWWGSFAGEVPSALEMVEEMSGEDNRVGLRAKLLLRLLLEAPAPPV